MQLRDYQESAVQAVRDSFRSGHKHTLLVSPTGSGKTVIFSYIAAGMARNNKRILIVAHRRELLKQISNALKKVGVAHAVMAGGYRGVPTANVVVASVFTLVKRIKGMQPFDLIIGDEAHHFTPDSSWGKVVIGFPRARVLGVTATPERLDGKGLGQMFDDMVMGPTVAELTAQGFLSHAIVYAPSAPDLNGVGTRMGDYVQKQLEEAMVKTVITGSAVKHYGKYAPGKKAIAFCVSVRHAKDVAAEFREAGYTASHIDGGMDEEERDGVLKAFEEGRVQVLTSCDLVSEGFDLPAVEVAILLRPTKSLGLYLQQCGRAIRPHPDKEKTIILDHAGNTARHGFIDDDREWSLADGFVQGRGGKGDKAETVRTCTACFAMHKPSPTCPVCGHVYPVKPRMVKHVDGDLVMMAREGEENVATPEGMLQNKFKVLTSVARKRGYKNPTHWAFNVICGQEAARIAKKVGARNAQTTNGLTEEERTAIWKMTMGTSPNSMRS
jgi:superfamily II DNA or RNA helicase